MKKVKRGEADSGVSQTPAVHLQPSQKMSARVRCTNCLSALTQTARLAETSCSHEYKTTSLPSSSSPRASLVHRLLCAVLFLFCLLGPCRFAWWMPLLTVETLVGRAPCSCERRHLFRRATCDRPGKRRCRPAQSRTVFTFFLPGSLCGGRVLGCSFRGWLNLKPGKKQTQDGRKGRTPSLGIQHCEVSCFLNQHIQAVRHLRGCCQVTA